MINKTRTRLEEVKLTYGGFTYYADPYIFDQLDEEFRNTPIDVLRNKVRNLYPDRGFNTDSRAVFLIILCDVEVNGP
jgi:hypothetical protein